MAHVDWGHMWPTKLAWVEPDVQTADYGLTALLLGLVTYVCRMQICVDRVANS